MTLREKYKTVLDYFISNRPEVKTELEYNDPYQLIVAVILSAQCTDKRVNIITPALFQRFPDAASMAEADVSEIYEFIRSCTYPNNKAKNLSGMAKILMKEFKGSVPSDPELLQKLPGVGRKTANVVASVLFDEPVIAVDTHVFRVSSRLGLVKNAKTPLDVELQLTRNIPENMRHNAHHWLILHGRYICKARNPLCTECGLKTVCNYYAKINRRPGKIKT
ncbi:MAG TPA: endonuclease III [Bacteroidales bacterium]|nr:endonuclease III [Bacteroidales bacterium]